jgi:hypothetical protein
MYNFFITHSLWRKRKEDYIMKKIALLMALVMLLSVLLCGCIASFECDICGEDVFGRKYTEEIFGEEIVYCSDCKEDMEELKDYFN